MHTSGPGSNLRRAFRTSASSNRVSTTSALCFKKRVPSRSSHLRSIVHKRAWSVTSGEPSKLLHASNRLATTPESHTLRLAKCVAGPTSKLGGTEGNHQKSVLFGPRHAESKGQDGVAAVKRCRPRRQRKCCPSPLSGALLWRAGARCRASCNTRRAVPCCSALENSTRQTV